MNLRDQQDWSATFPASHARSSTQPYPPTLAFHPVTANLVARRHRFPARILRVQASTEWDADVLHRYLLQHAATLCAQW